MLRPWAEQKLDSKKKTVPLPSGNVSFRKLSPEFYVSGEKASAKSKKLTDVVRRFAPEYLKIEEYTDWSTLKDSLIVTKTGSVVNANGEILNWITGVERPDEITVKERK